MTNTGIRVNKVSVLVEDDMARISLYRTNTKVAEFWNNDIEVPDFSLTDVNKTVYQQYCRDVTINLLQNGGIEGLYYEEKKSDPEAVKKFGTSDFISTTRKMISDTFHEIFEDTYDDHIFDIKGGSDNLEVTERYKDGNIKFAEIWYDVTIDTTKLQILAEIKSGQMCKIKTMRYNDAEMSINASNIRRIMK